MERYLIPYFGSKTRSTKRVAHTLSALVFFSQALSHDVIYFYLQVLPAIASIISLEAEADSALDAKEELAASDGVVPALPDGVVPAGFYQRPKGRAPKDKAWDATAGAWVDTHWVSTSSSATEPADVESNSTSAEDAPCLPAKVRSKREKVRTTPIEARVFAEISALHRILIKPPLTGGNQEGSLSSMLQVFLTKLPPQMLLYVFSQ